MMVRHKVTLLITFFVISLAVFFIWHYVFSIYEVKFVYNFDPAELQLNEHYIIKAVAVNSFGWNLNFRNVDLQYNILSGGSFIEVNIMKSKNTIDMVIRNYGEIIIELDSKFSLNSTTITLRALGKAN